MSNITSWIEVLGVEVEVEIEFDYTPAVKGKLYGPPEKCEAPEAAQLTVNSVEIVENNVKHIDISALLAMPEFEENIIDLIADVVL